MSTEKKTTVDRPAIQNKEPKLLIADYARKVVGKLTLKANEAQAKLLEARRLQGLVGSSGGVVGHDDKGKEVSASEGSLRKALAELDS